MKSKLFFVFTILIFALVMGPTNVHAEIITGTMVLKATTAGGAPMDAWVSVFDENGVNVKQAPLYASFGGSWPVTLPAGTYNVTMRLKRYGFGSNIFIQIDNIVVPPNRQAIAEAKFGRITLKATTANGDPASAWVDVHEESGKHVWYGQLNANGGGVASINLPPGTYNVTMRLTRYGIGALSHIKIDNLVLTANGGVTAEAKFGRLDIKTTDANGGHISAHVEVYNDGVKFADGWTSQSDGWIWFDLIPGTYKIVSGASSRDEVLVFPGEVTTVILGPPDLVISSSDIAFSNETLPEGEITNISVTIHNTGDADITGTVFNVYDGDPENGTLITTLSTGQMTAGGSETINALWTASPIGLHEIHVVVDPANDTYEISEDNNHAWAEVNVTVSNVGPVAYIDSISLSQVVVGDNVNFIGHGADEDGSVVAYEWRSSIDGFLSDQTRFTTSTLSVGNHTIYFRVQDDYDVWSEAVSAELEVKPNQPPVAIASAYPTPAYVGDVVISSGAGSYDPDGEIVSYNWDFGDGTTGAGSESQNIYEEPGIYTATLTVTDDNGAENAASVLVEVKGKPDLTVSQGDIQVSDGDILDIIHVTATIHNIGSADAGSFNVRIEYSPNYPLLSDPDVITVPGLAAGGSMTVGGDFRAMFGKYTIKVIVDPEGSI